jgi:DNA-directed RNA polymerase specialized sigma24 family protein
LIALDEALDHLSRLDPVKARIVELKCFGGLTACEMAEALGMTVHRVNHHWRFAKAWLANEMKQSLSTSPVKNAIAA